MLMQQKKTQKLKNKKSLPAIRNREGAGAIE